MSAHISSELRQYVSKRANHCCEYCLLPQSVAIHKHEPDHVVPLQHGGETEEQNLALACMRCNRYKGTNVGSFDPETDKLVPFFDPRKHNWSEHFKLISGFIRPLTPEARVTVKILRLNDEKRVRERQQLAEVGFYPPKHIKL